VTDKTAPSQATHALVRRKEPVVSTPGFVNPIADAIRVTAVNISEDIYSALGNFGQCIVHIEDLRMVVHGGARDQQALDEAIARLRAALPSGSGGGEP
jgi:hypothetical protein